MPRPLPIETLENTPDAVFEKAKREFAELHGSPKVEASRYFVLTIVFAIVSIILAIVIAALFPLKKIQPIVVEVREGEVVTRRVEARSYTPTDGMIKQAAAQFTERMWRINTATMRDDLKLALSWLRGTAVGQFTSFLNAEKQFDRLAQQPLLSRTISDINIDTSRPGVAFVFFSTVERIGTSEPVIVKRRMTLNYLLIPPETEEQVYKNAAGMTITNFDYATEKR